MAMTTKDSANKNEELMFGDCCTFMNLGALAVADLIFDDDNSVASKDDGFAFVRCGSSWTQPRLIQVSDSEDDSETLETYDEDDTLEFTVTDGETTLTKQTLEEDEDERNASDTDNNTLTDINTLMSSKLSDSRDVEHREKIVKGEGRKESKPRSKSMRTKPRRPFDDDATLDSVEVTMFQEPYYRTNKAASTTSKRSGGRRRRQDDGKGSDIPKEITSPSVQKRIGAPFRLKRLVSRGRLGGSARPNKYHPVPEPATIESVVLSSRIRSKLYDEDEDVPFDEPLWYN